MPVRSRPSPFIPHTAFITVTKHRRTSVGFNGQSIVKASFFDIGEFKWNSSLLPALVQHRIAEQDGEDDIPSHVTLTCGPWSRSRDRVCVSRGKSDFEAVAEGQGGLSFADPTQASITSQTPNRVITLDYELIAMDHLRGMPVSVDWFPALPAHSDHGRVRVVDRKVQAAKAEGNTTEKTNTGSVPRPERRRGLIGSIPRTFCTVHYRGRCAPHNAAHAAHSTYIGRAHIRCTHTARAARQQAAGAPLLKGGNTVSSPPNGRRTGTIALDGP
ncbi:hypothetical protein B0H16DRAFT_1466258 [Mycena metata]|uniref:Uncharacterized protein n=1 Tax=Mycena metata TaxID=1033252 RepID=A0AAD7I8S0_9AGAR|nr:hypothetical protein B0H16DRAFT_1466258 [Mycena metata]